MPEETTVDESATAEANSQLADEAAPQEAPTADRGSRQKKQRARNRDYNEFAFREMRRARKLFSAETDGSEAQFAIQMAHVAAMLGLSESVRGLRNANGDEDAD